MTITSKDNEKLKTVRKLNSRRRDRDHLGLFVAEGEDLVQAAAQAGWEPVELLAAEGSGLAGNEVEPALLRQVTELSSGTRQLGVYRQRWAEDPRGRLNLYLHGVGDPGNVGTILRSAAAFGAGAVILGPGTADPFSPKAVRASMGAIFQVPLCRAAVLQDGSPDLTALPGTSLALDARGAATLAQTAERIGDEERVTILVGAEREGLPEALRTQAGHVAKIPIATESLNAGVAAAVALYELTRRITTR